MDRAPHGRASWELTTDALLMILARKRVLTIDEHRRAMEELSPDRYESLTYYQRWLTAIEALLMEKGVLAVEEVNRASST